MLSSLNLGNDSWKSDLLDLCEFYRKDLPEFHLINAEINLWEEYWLQYKGDVPKDLISTLQTLPVGFENISIMLRILATMPFSSCECERSFSSMKRLKTYIRSTMTADRLNGLALMHVHQNIAPDIEKVIDMFASDNRRLNFI